MPLSALRLFVDSLFLTPSTLGDIEDFGRTGLAADCGLTGCAREAFVRASWSAAGVELPSLAELGLDALRTGTGSCRSPVSVGSGERPRPPRRSSSPPSGLPPAPAPSPATAAS